MKLAGELERTGASGRIEAVTVTESFRLASSDDRFALILDAVSPTARKSSKVQPWVSPHGKTAARIAKLGAQTSITFDEKRVPHFAIFVAERLDALYEEFSQRQEGGE